MPGDTCHYDSVNATSEELEMSKLFSFLVGSLWFLASLCSHVSSWGQYLTGCLSFFLYHNSSNSIAHQVFVSSDTRYRLSCPHSSTHSGVPIIPLYTGLIKRARVAARRQLEYEAHIWNWKIEFVKKSDVVPKTALSRLCYSCGQCYYLYHLIFL